MGAALGPIVTGFFLLEYFTLPQCLLLTGAGTFALALACGVKARHWRTAPVAAIFAVVALAGVLANPFLVARIIAVDLAEDQRIGGIVETRSGIVYTVRTPGRPDMTFGGNVYDGMINTSLRTNQNGIHRAYVLDALHPAPKRVLVIGLSSGAWTWVASRMSGVEHIDVVEINNGYVEVIRGYPEVAGILSDPRIKLHIDDGRRWLRRNPASKYDLIIMNTTYNWRAYSTNLLSVEFQTILRAHLNPGGVATYNTTDSPDAYATAAQVYPFVRKYENFVYVSDHDFVATIPRHKSRLWQMTDGTTPVLDASRPEDAAAVDMMFRIPFNTVPEIREAVKRPLEIITDDNLLTEYKYGRRSGLIPFVD
jgi:spermidine synthase